MARCKSLIMLAVVVVAASLVLLIAGPARAIEIKKSLYQNPPSQGGEQAGAPASKSPYSQAQIRSLNEGVANDMDTFAAQESEKKASGQLYADLESTRPRYFPGPGNTVTAKLEAVEYKPSKSGTGKGSPTGKKRTLVLKYKLDGGKWTQVEQPKWEEGGGAVAAAGAPGKK